MRTIRRRNWFIRRFALGLAIAAFAAPAAQATVDEGSSVQANGLSGVRDGLPLSAVRGRSPTGIVNSDYPSLKPTVVASAYGMPRATPMDYAINRGDLIEVVRSTPSGSPSDKIEFVRTQPRSIGEPQLVSAGFDWKDAGIGAGLALALVLLGGGAALASRRVGRPQTA